MTDTQKQCLLTYLGYDTGGVDGIWGDKSRQATEAFQRDYSLDPDGVFGDATLTRIKEVIISGEQPTSQPRQPQEATDGGEDWWQNIRYWTREEFKCRCGEYHAPYCNGYPVEPDRKLVELADDVRAHFGRPGIRSSGIRCPWHNRDSGGVSNSRHLLGKALDFYIEGVSGSELLTYVQSDPRTNYAYIIEGNYVHMDVN
ncbi:MAG: D-Ala-D-Ala carboxypeptidase family metallohydrolase [Candidatus Limivicinus sp.]